MAASLTTLRDLSTRLDALHGTPNPTEAQAFKTWLESGSFEVLRLNLIGFLDTVIAGTVERKTYPIEVNTPKGIFVISITKATTGKELVDEIKKRASLDVTMLSNYSFDDPYFVMGQELDYWDKINRAPEYSIGPDELVYPKWEARKFATLNYGRDLSTILPG